MAKGKYAERATRRRDDAEVVAAEEGYKRQIVRLTQERNEARAERDDSRAAHRKEVRLLQAQNREGTNHRVVALQRTCQKLRDETDRERRRASDIHRHWQVAITHLMQHFQEHHGMSHEESVGAAMTLLEGDGSNYVWESGANRAKGSDEESEARVVAAVQAARRRTDRDRRKKNEGLYPRSALE